MDGHKAMNMDKLGEIFSSTVGLMQNAMQGLAQRNSTIYNLLYMSDNMQNKGDYEELLPNEMKFNKQQIIKWVLGAILLYMLVTVLSYIFVNYILFYAVIFIVAAIAIKFYFYYQQNDDTPLLQQTNYHHFEAHSI
ncbi:conserved Plasmodium protein, unknown function [Plasmodium knowlesi strain H]|uniref:Uncharacterized protein n=3 Tax=Plasmodium knowlesi TaxID=5850 RepID=A0A5K1U4J8_PLAKH|nr:conserved Plasmodium protein, unknown function [Plasmodium knowlesi strain H]OTN64599.1 Uncharacterized protein PKNOH_S130179200 [Plasmodium knowlesi]CAA9988960.1 conserved Plasmodium protein, unknown function [Plasmodium knowlesi strain H]SBO24804.1 conserved Plasmodium protein, unknown function [Plasmodium knowlesi strain H]SBO28067.1 conserved Plasmodium protein, unknown function [Plasmodium knowlesi strain H]VVS78434.1 conserved Plasmodium protein, unknown function [Plasmodium knowlesi |eukprot:XP_002261308.1 hypothetical protein, conserved in Plasmodium species [Plasmodium knowlesi strain H]